MELLLLGSFDARDGDVSVQIGRRHERCLLGLLALESGRAIATHRLLDLLWDGNPPAGARGMLHTYVARLRAKLRPEGGQIVRQGDGYALVAPKLDVDAYRFAALVEEADRADDPALRAELYGRALDLWRGEILADVASDYLRERVGSHLVEMRWRSVERRAEALLSLDECDVLVSEFGDVAARHPGREALIAHVMLAYYRLRRQADALVLYQGTRDYLAGELGVDPGQELQDLHARVLRNDPDLAAGSRKEPDRGVVPRQLPRDRSDFVGRRDDLAALDALTGSGGTVTISAVSGMSGVGKTALATRWAYSAADRFPDGHLYLDLRGYAAVPPVSTSEGLSYLIRSLGHASDEIPADEQAAAGLYRTLMADRRALLILDNARSAEQVRPLLPGSAASVVLVTSRDTLAGLVALDGARVHSLDILKPSESFDLLCAIVGADRAEAERDAADRLAALAGHLPLAVRILGAHLAVSPDRSIADLVESLLHRSSLGDIAVDGDPRANVQAVFAHSYLALTPEQRRLFRLLGVAPGPDVTLAAVVALIGDTVAAAAATLDALIAAHLIDERDPGRFSMHDLVREYAYECALADDTADARASAANRLASWYVDTARTALDTIFPAITVVPRDAEYEPEFDDEVDARAWLDAEATNMMLIIRGPREPVAPLLRCQLADPLRMYFWVIDLPLPTWIPMATEVLELAQGLRDPYIEAASHAALGVALEQAARYEEVLVHYRIASTIGAACGWTRMVEFMNASVGVTSFHLGRFEEAVEMFRAAVETQTRRGNMSSLANNLGNLGNALTHLGRLAEATETLTRTLALVREHGPRHSVPIHLINLGLCHHEAGRFPEALAAINESLEIQRSAAGGGGDGEAVAMKCLAGIYLDMGRLDLALPLAREALAKLQLLGTPASEPHTSNTLGSVLFALDRVDEAIEQHEYALRLAREQGGVMDVGEARLGLARTNLARGALAAAQEHAQAAYDGAAAAKLRILEGQSLTMLAEIAAAQARPQQALAYARSALAIHQETGHAQGEARTLKVFELLAG